MNWLRKVWDFFGTVFAPSTADKIMTGIRKAAPYIQMAMELASVAATFTKGGRTVQAVLDYASHLGVQAVLSPNVTEAELGTVLRNLTVDALKLKFPQADTSTLNRAVEIAVGAIKS